MPNGIAPVLVKTGKSPNFDADGVAVFGGSHCRPLGIARVSCAGPSG